jgi:hypothetical protein
MSDRMRYLLAGCLVAGAFFAWAVDRPAVPPSPGPSPPEPLPIVLRGKFTGPTGAEDAATFAAVCAELADQISWDGSQAEPLFKTGAALDALRTRSRELRCRGDSIGDRQPAARDAVHAYLDSALGTAGGPVSDAQRAKWVQAYQILARAAADATR